MTSSPRLYIIEAEPDDLHLLDIRRLGEIIALHSSSERATICFSPSMAKQLAYGLLALLSNEFDRAVTETTLRIERERTDRATQTPSPSVPLPQPELDNL